MQASHTDSFTKEEYADYLMISGKDKELRREERPYFKKSGLEYGPTWHQKKEYVHRIINESTYPEEGRMRLKKELEAIPHFQFRGFKYGLATSSAVFFLLPVVRRQTFLRRFAISMIPMGVFLRWGYNWGHMKWWRRSYPIITIFEIGTGTRNKFTGK